MFYRFIDIYTGQTPDKTRWYTGEPNDTGGDEDCALAKREGDSVYWNDVPCHWAYPTVCLSEPNTPEIFTVEDALTFEEAQSACAEINGRLPLVRTLYEAEEMFQATNNAPFWISINDRTDEGRYNSIVLK